MSIRRFALASLVFWSFSSCTKAPAQPAPALPAGGTSIAWDVDVHEDLSLDERVCWRGFSPGKIGPDMPEAARFAKPSAALDAKQHEGCVSFTYGLGEAARGLDEDRGLRAFGGAVFGSFDAWLWRPAQWPAGLHGKLRVRAPKGIDVALPMRKAEDGAFVVPEDTWTYMARGAIGKLHTDRIEAEGAAITIRTLPGGARTVTDEGLRHFVRGAAKAVATIDGKLPVDSLEVFLLPGREHGWGEPVQFGMAMRGGGPHVMMFVGPNATDDTLYGEWIGVHELSHLWLPPLQGETAWLSEGVASYYQCILRSRAGMYSEREGWSELLAGFARGKAQAGNLPLRDARRPRFQQIYWGGAAIAFAIDVALRRQGSSLDRAVAKLRHATSDEKESDEGTVLDALGGRAIADRLLAMPFPDVGSDLTALGIREGALDDAAPEAALRRAIATR